MSWVIPAPISVALTISPLHHYPIDSPPKSQNPGPLLSAAVEGKGKEDTPHWAQLGFKNVKLFSSTKFQPGQQRWDSVLGPLPAHLIRRSVPSPSSFSLPFSGSTGGSAISLTPNTAVNSFLWPSLTLIPDFENNTQWGGRGWGG